MKERISTEVEMDNKIIGAQGGCTVEEQPQDMGQDEDSSMVLGWRPGQVKPRDKQQWKRLYNDKKRHKRHW
jgi:hypothetical protein